MANNTKAKNRRPPQEPVASQPLAWFRAVGAISIFAGGLGLLKMFYVPSVAAIYLGIGLMVIDLAYEKMRPVVKLPLLVVLVAFVWFFTNFVVLHRSPMQYEYRVNNGKLDLEIRNDSHDDDYSDLDLVISPTQSGSNIFVGDVQFVNSYPTCALIHNPGEVPNGRTSLVYSHDGALEDWSDVFRIRCGTLPRDFSIMLRVQLVASSGVHVPPSPITPPPQVPTVRGEFTGRFHTVEVNKNFESMGG